MAPIFANNEQQFAQLAAATGLTVDQVRAAAEALGLIPDVITKQVQIEGGDQAIQELNNVALAFRASDDLSIEFQVDDEAARANLESLGFTLENIPGTKNVQITAPNELALAALQEVIDRTVAVDAQSATPEINADTTGFVLGEGQVRDALADIDRTQVDPAVGAVIDDFLAGRDVTLAELARIDATKADPEVMLLIQRALADAQIISAEIDKAARKRDALIQVRAQWDPDARAAYFGSPTVQGPMPIGGNADGGRLPAYATGGRMPSTGPGTETTDGIYAVTPEGVPIAMVDGEWVINSESSDKYDRELAMINAGIFPKLPGFETGGRIAADRAASFLRSESGKPYQYGGVGNPSWDCSGFVSAAYAQLKGLDPYTRWFTTESNFGALGFLAGLGGPSDLSIGVHNGGGGQYSHMAGTLDNTPFEAGSNGVRWGSGAAGANDPQFENRYHLPAAAFNPPGTGAMRLDRTITWSESDELKLDSARIAIRQAEEDRDRIHADPKKTQADRDQANNKVAQAEAKVRELEADKYKAETGDTGPAPQAPELTTTRTDDELRMRDLERAIDEANERRNEVYADPASTQNDRTPPTTHCRKRATPSKKTQQARDKNEDGEGITASSIAELFGNVAKARCRDRSKTPWSHRIPGDGALSQAVLLGVEEATKKRDNDIPKVAPLHRGRTRQARTSHPRHRRLARRTHEDPASAGRAPRHGRSAPARRRSTEPVRRRGMGPDRRTTPATPAGPPGACSTASRKGRNPATRRHGQPPRVHQQPHAATRGQPTDAVQERVPRLRPQRSVPSRPRRTRTGSPDVPQEGITPCHERPPAYAPNPDAHRSSETTIAAHNTSENETLTNEQPSPPRPPTPTPNRNDARPPSTPGAPSTVTGAPATRCRPTPVTD
ncbi:NlpC/P60 family protein [Rhodococcus pyridinivorans]|uniref:NlpC/P60 family protein n=1 Tax=Rhodococcus pyridinivorans TaxID=103816 RepID=UPI001E5960AC|nr:NlpC/P60 family protein [Rhodococcus pyridinivorans]UGQ58961.1 NlpC/P60 family protein [Rhodococcus pyridinivorans]